MWESWVKTKKTSQLTCRPISSIKAYYYKPLSLGEVYYTASFCHRWHPMYTKYALRSKWICQKCLIKVALKSHTFGN